METSRCVSLPFLSTEYALNEASFRVAGRQRRDWRSRTSPRLRLRTLKDQAQHPELVRRQHGSDPRWYPPVDEVHHPLRLPAPGPCHPLPLTLPRLSFLLSPERITKGTLSRATDVWSYGILCWELLTLEVPFGHMPENEVRRCIVDGRKPAFPKETPLSTKTFIENCWAPSPDARPSFAVLIKYGIFAL